VPHLSERPAGRALRVAALISGLLVAACAPVGALAAPGRDVPGVPPDTTRVMADQLLIFDTNLGLIERATAEAVTEALAGLRLTPGSDIRLHALTNHEGGWFVEDFIARFLSDQGYYVHLVKKPVPGAPGLEGTPSAGAPPGGGSLADVMGGGRKPAPADTAQAAGDKSAPTGLGAAMADTSRAGGKDSDAAGGQPAGPGGPRRTAGQPGEGAGRTPKPEEIIPIPEGEGMVLTFRLIEFGVTYHDSWRRGFLGPRMVERLASVNLYCRLVNGSAEDVLWVGRGKSARLDIVPKSRLDLLEGLSYPFTAPMLRPKPLSRLLEPVLVTGIVGGLVYLFYANQ
jgi:hypothetical protein